MCKVGRSWMKSIRIEKKKCLKTTVVLVHIIVYIEYCMQYEPMDVNRSNFIPTRNTDGGIDNIFNVNIIKIKIYSCLLRVGMLRIIYSYRIIN